MRKRNVYFLLVVSLSGLMAKALFRVTESNDQ